MCGGLVLREKGGDPEGPGLEDGINVRVGSDGCCVQRAEGAPRAVCECLHDHEGGKALRPAVGVHYSEAAVVDVDVNGPEVICARKAKQAILGGNKGLDHVQLLRGGLMGDPDSPLLRAAGVGEELVGGQGAGTNGNAIGHLLADPAKNLLLQRMALCAAEACGWHPVYHRSGLDSLCQQGTPDLDTARNGVADRADGWGHGELLAAREALKLLSVAVYAHLLHVDGRTEGLHHPGRSN